jgi:hypothetical protein
MLIFKSPGRALACGWAGFICCARQGRACRSGGRSIRIPLKYQWPKARAKQPAAKTPLGKPRRGLRAEPGHSCPGDMGGKPPDMGVGEVLLFPNKNICTIIHAMALRVFPCLSPTPRTSFSAPAPHSFQKRLLIIYFYSSASPQLPFRRLILPLPQSAIPNFSSFIIPYALIPLPPSLCSLHSFPIRSSKTNIRFTPKYALFREIPQCPTRYGGKIFVPPFVLRIRCAP